MNKNFILGQTINSLIDYPVKVVCPSCHNEDFSVQEGTLEPKIRCEQCSSIFSVENGFADLVVGERFEDGSDSECLCYEEDSNEYTTRNFWVPLFKTKLSLSEKSKLLAIGCGIGREVDMLCDEGLDCIGIDNGNRSKIWPKRKYKNRFIMANGMHLPFEDNSFDVVFCGCVFPHVGVIGDSVNVKDSYMEERAQLASEMARVLKPGGEIVLASPNRLFPFDIFHGRESGSYLPRFNRPGERFLLTARDYKCIFNASGLSKLKLLPVEGYWGFVRSRSNIKGFILGLPIRFTFYLLSKPAFAFLRGSFISPWLVVMLSDDNEPRAANS